MDEEKSAYEVAEQHELDEVSIHHPVMLFDGNCEDGHDFVYHHTDSDGMVNKRCSRCPMGILVRE